MDFRFVPDAPATWLVYDLGAVVVALPSEFRAVADALAATAGGGVPDVPGVIAALETSGIAAAAPFAALAPDTTGVRVALRGPATVAAGAESLTGLGVDGVLERRIPGVSVVRLTVPGGEWTLTVGTPPAPTPTALRPRDEVTAIPDLEISAPVLPAPPTLGLMPVADADDRTVLASELPPVPGLPVVPAPGEDPTVVVEEIARLRASRSAGLNPPAGMSPPPRSAAPVPAPPAPEPPAPVAHLELPDGSREPLDVAVVIGRAPAVPADSGPSRVVRLTGDGDISRTHARVAVEGGTVVVTDLGSRNGTVVRIPGRAAQKLRSGEPTPVLPGTVIDFGGGVEVRVGEE